MHSFEEDYPALRRVYPFEYFTSEQGLPSNEACDDVLIDSQGMLWVATIDGLARFDGYTFVVYRNDPGNPLSLSGNWTWNLHEDRYGTMWIAAGGAGLNAFDRRTKSFIRYLQDPQDSTSLSDNSIFDFLEDRKGRLWVWTMNGGLNEIVRDTNPAESANWKGRIVRYPHNVDSLNYTDNDFLAFFREDSLGFLWIGTSRGVMRFDPESRTFTYNWKHPLIPPSLRNKAPRHIIEDRLGSVWIATGEGLFRYQKANDSLTHYRHDLLDTHTLTSNDLMGMYEDHYGTIWVTTKNDGMNEYDRRSGRFIRHKYNKNDPYSFKGTHWNWEPRFVEDSAGNLWIPAPGVGLAKLRRSKGFRHFLHEPNTQESQAAGLVFEDTEGILWVEGSENRFRKIPAGEKLLPFDYSIALKNTVHTVYGDGRGTLWFGTWGDGLVRFEKKSGRVTSFKRDPGNKKATFMNNVVLSIAPDPDGTLWIGTYEAGLCKFNPRTMKYMKEYKTEIVWDIIRDDDGILWLGTEGGLNRFDPRTEEFDVWATDPHDPQSISNDMAKVLFEDASGTLWVGTTNGLNKFDKRMGKFTRYLRGSGKSNKITSIIEDTRGHIWVGYQDDGLSRLDPASGTFKTFSVHDGLPSNVFGLGAYRRPTGEIVMGTAGGILVFHPDSIRESTFMPQVLITKISVFDSVVSVPSFDLSDAALTLPYDQNFISFEFVVLDLTVPERNQHLHKLEGFDEQWNSSGTKRDVRYTNIPPGEYIFRVKGTNSDGVWSDKEAAVSISITPPWWKTTWAYGGYAIAILGLLYSFRRFERNRERLKHQAELEHVEAEKLREVDQLKSRFFSNISHEFRTPLTLIEGPATQLASGKYSNDVTVQAGMIARNSRRLLRLVNQLLDLSRIESGQKQLAFRNQDLGEAVRGIAASFESLAAHNEIAFSINVPDKPYMGWFDRDVVEKIVTNMLSNAFKFTHRGGEVRITITPIPPSKGGGKSDEQGKATIMVADTGIGIPEAVLPRIFDRFYQVDASHTRNQEGTGIGLALTKELVELHAGEITAISEVGKGSTFTVQIPIRKDLLKKEWIVDYEDHRNESAGYPVRDPFVDPAVLDQQTDKTSKESLPLLLLVEDNADMRTYIRTRLGQYRVIEAVNGEDGVAQAIETIPDLIISDVMMPKMDGFQLCKILKQDERTSHIPIILLTARAGSENKIEGLETGADDYVTKPFDSRELQARTKNLIDQRRALRERFREEGTLKLKDIAITSTDERFLNRAMEVIEGRISDIGFTVEIFAQEMYLSRMQLHRKIKALTDRSPWDFVRLRRLERASQLLRKGAGTIAEVASQVGYDDPSHFADVFRRQFGVTPSEYVRLQSAQKK